MLGFYKMVVHSRIRSQTKKLTVEQFVDVLNKMSNVKPAESCSEDIKGEIFLTDKAFSKLLAADDTVSDIFIPSVAMEAKTGIVGVLKSKLGHKYNVRTNAMQRSIHRDYEGLADGDIELRLFS